MEYEPPSPNSDDLVYLTLPTATISVSTIKEIMGMCWTVMFPDGYSGGISTWTGDNDCVNWSFQDMVVGFPRLEEFGTGGPTKVGR